MNTGCGNTIWRHCCQKTVNMSMFMVNSWPKAQESGIISFFQLLWFQQWIKQKPAAKLIFYLPNLSTVCQQLDIYPVLIEHLITIFVSAMVMTLDPQNLKRYWIFVKFLSWPFFNNQNKSLRTVIPPGINCTTINSSFLV